MMFDLWRYELFQQKQSDDPTWKNTVSDLGPHDTWSMHIYPIKFNQNFTAITR